MFGWFKSGNSIAPEEVRDNLGKENVLVLDVRTKEEFKDGHLQSAKNISIDNLESRIKEIESFKDKKVIVYCHSGMRSARAVGILKKKGFTDVRNMKGGTMNWKFEKVK